MPRKPPTREYEIETGIPMPERRVFKGVRAALRAMKVGDSIVIDGNQRPNAHDILGAGKFVTARTEDGRLRVWRTK